MTAGSRTRRGLVEEVCIGSISDDSDLVPTATRQVLAGGWWFASFVPPLSPLTESKPKSTLGAGLGKHIDQD